MNDLAHKLVLGRITRYCNSKAPLINNRPRSLWEMIFSFSTHDRLTKKLEDCTSLFQWTFSIFLTFFRTCNIATPLTTTTNDSKQANSGSIKMMHKSVTFFFLLLLSLSSSSVWGQAILSDEKDVSSFVGPRLDHHHDRTLKKRAPKAPSYKAPTAPKAPKLRTRELKKNKPPSSPKAPAVPKTPKGGAAGRFRDLKKTTNKAPTAPKAPAAPKSPKTRRARA